MKSETVKTDMEEILEENPLQQTNSFKITPHVIKNCAGRPTNSKIIKFSEQPKSIISREIKEKTIYDCIPKDLVCTEILQNNQIDNKPRLMEMCTINTDNRLKIFSCSYKNCTYSTKISSNLTKHKRTHTNDKLYLCDECTFSTKFSNSLNVHKRLHSNIKPFICQYCQYCCNSSSNLKKHQNNKHLDKR